MYIDPNIVSFYFWIHVILLGIFGGTLLYQMVPYDDEEEDNRPTPKDEDEGDRDWL